MKNQFTYQLAIVDAIPVVLFSISVSLISLQFPSMLFRVGSFLCIMAGLMKVLWKFLMVSGRDIALLSGQLRYVMPTGFVLLIISCCLDQTTFVSSTLLNILTFPAILFFMLCFGLMILMFYFARVGNQRDVRSNWKEQGVNILMQLFFLFGIISILLY